MAKKKADPEQTEQEPVDIQDDEYRGIGGSYLFDPQTGKRTRVAGPALEDARQAEQQPETETLETETVNESQ